MTKAKKSYVLVRCGDYNGHKNVLFMMDTTDFRLSDERFSSNYEVLAPGEYAGRARQLTVAERGETYQVFEDWSLKLIETKPLAAADLDTSADYKLMSAAERLQVVHGIRRGLAKLGRAGQLITAAVPSSRPDFTLTLDQLVRSECARDQHNLVLLVAGHPIAVPRLAKKVVDRSRGDVMFEDAVTAIQSYGAEMREVYEAGKAA